MILTLGSAAGARAIAEHRNPTRDWEGLCLRFVRTCFGVAPRWPYATEAYRSTTKRMGTAGTPPAWVPIWWAGGRYGHVALSAGGGYCWSNDILRPGKIDKVTIPTITRGWGMAYQGWTEDINGVDVYVEPVASFSGRRVHASAVLDASRRDPGAPQGVASHPHAVGIVERALVAEGLLDDRWIDGAWGSKTEHAWRRWQRRRGDDSPTGVPGRKGLEALGRRHNFTVLD